MKQRFENLDALRGLAAVTVLVQHLLDHVCRAVPQIARWTEAVGLDRFDEGRFGVVLFFLISGYVVPFSFSGDRPMRKFIVSRIFRLYPPFWISVIAMAAAFAVIGEFASPHRILANLTMAWPLFGEHSLCGVYWTLSIELLFYAVALALFAVGALESPVVIAAIAIAAIGSAVVPIIAAQWGIAMPLRLTGYHLSFLLLGSLIRLARQRRPGSLASAALVGGAIALTLPIVSGLGGVGNPAFSMSPVGVTFAIAAAAAVFLASWLDVFPRPGPIALSLGAWSYSLYLLHEPVATVMERVIPIQGVPSAAAFAFAVTALTIIASAAVYRWIEKPSIAAGKAIAARRDASALTTPGRADGPA